MSEAFERVILGSVLIDDRRWDEVSSLEADDFSLQSHRAIWREMQKMKDAGLSIDYVALSARKGPAWTAQIGGMAYLSGELVEGLPRMPNLAQYAEGIKEDGRRKRAIMGAAALLKALEGGDDVDAAVEKLNKKLPALESKKAAATAPRAAFMWLSDVKPERVQWLWKPYLPLGMLAMISGDSDVGKSYALQAIAAGLTLGQLPCGAGPCPPINVLHFTVENSREYTLRPRFDGLGGDPNRYAHCRGCEWIDNNGETRECGITLADIPMLDALLAETRAKLVIIDPIVSYLPTSTDAHRANEVRQILDPLAKLAEKHQCCIVLIRHLNKGVGGKAIYRGSMSVDFTAAVRSELLAGHHPDDPSKQALVHIVHNLSPAGPTIGYQILEGGDLDQGRFEWTGISDLTASQMLADPANESSDSAHALKEAADWLRDFLTPDSQAQPEIVKQAEQNGISFATLRRAKARLGVKSRRATFRGSFTWSLPQAAQSPLILEPVEPLGESQHEPKDLDRLNDLSHLGEPVEPLGESQLAQISPTGSSEKTGLSHFGKDKNNKDLSIYSSITNSQPAQPAQHYAHAREVPNGFDPVR